MSVNSPPKAADEKAADELDELLSDFFKSQLKRPWPNAPVPESTARAEPSELAAARAQEAPRNTTVPAASPRPHDNTARARYTLAASVALLLGTGWLLTDGLQPAVCPAPGSVTHTPGHKFLPDSGADGNDHGPLKKMGEDKAKGNGGIKVDVDGIE